MHIQVLRVTSATPVSGSGSGSSGFGSPTNVYSALTQQGSGSNSYRDREPCFLWEPNGNPLALGYYLARLIGSFTSGGDTYPLYATCEPGQGASLVVYARFVTHTLPAFTSAGRVLTAVAVGALTSFSCDQLTPQVGDNALYCLEGVSSVDFAVYTFTSVGSPTTRWSMTPVAQWSLTAAAEVFVGPEGTINKRTVWQVVTQNTIVPGTTPVQFSRAYQEKRPVQITGPISGSTYPGSVYFNNFEMDVVCLVSDANGAILQEGQFYDAARDFDIFITGTWYGLYVTDAQSQAPFSEAEVVDEVLCINGILEVYKVVLMIVNGVLVAGVPFFDHSAGCCVCAGGSGSQSSGSGKSWYCTYLTFASQPSIYTCAQWTYAQYLQSFLPGANPTYVSGPYLTEGACTAACTSGGSGSSSSSSSGGGGVSGYPCCPGITIPSVLNVNVESLTGPPCSALTPPFSVPIVYGVAPGWYITPDMFGNAWSGSFLDNNGGTVEIAFACAGGFWQMSLMLPDGSLSGAIADSGGSGWSCSPPSWPFIHNAGTECGFADLINSLVTA